ncbi:family 1 glycosylhydrolase, partial [Klebsiella pneumoniae]|uniref:family 1 glycosylhydrolase n=1 Tax=Klebsiella pneumoniae TaxID=573 RepID=UPI003EE321B2
ADSFYRMIKRFWLYGTVKNIMITESGACFRDRLVAGSIHDQLRINYFEQYLRAVLKAKKEGVHVSGFIAWTLTDNFEWNEGFQAPF